MLNTIYQLDPFGPHEHKLLTTARTFPFATLRFVTLFTGLFHVPKITNFILNNFYFVGVRLDPGLSDKCSNYQHLWRRCLTNCTV